MIELKIRITDRQNRVLEHVMKLSGGISKTAAIRLILERMVNDKEWRL